MKKKSNKKIKEELVFDIQCLILLYMIYEQKYEYKDRIWNLIEEALNSKTIKELKQILR